MANPLFYGERASDRRCGSADVRAQAQAFIRICVLRPGRCHQPAGGRAQWEDDKPRPDSMP